MGLWLRCSPGSYVGGYQRLSVSSVTKIAKLGGKLRGRIQLLIATDNMCEQHAATHPLSRPSVINKLPNKILDLIHHLWANVGNIAEHLKRYYLVVRGLVGQVGRKVTPIAII